MKRDAISCFLCKARSKKNIQVTFKDSDLLDKYLCKSCYRDHVFNIRLKQVLGFKN